MKNPEVEDDALIFYCDIGDYFTREEKLDIVNRTPDILNGDFKPLIPNDEGNWLNQRGEKFLRR